MATFDDIARMRAALMAEKRQRMAQHPQQVAGAVGQAQGALAALAEQLQRQGIARDRITAANARAEADRKQRAAVEAAKAKAAAEKARLDREAADARAASELDWKRERFGEEQRIDPDAQRMRGFAVSERIAPPPPGDDDMPDGDDDLATPDERMRALLPDDRYDLRAFQQAEEDRERAARKAEADIRRLDRSGRRAPKTAEQVERQRVKDELDRKRLELVEQQMAERRTPGKADRDTFDINVAAVNAANGARSVLGKVPTGYLAWKAGRIAAGLPGGGDFGRELRRLERDVGILVQNAGRKNEGGKLADADYYRYQRMFGNLDEFTPQQILDAVNDIDRQIREEHKRQISSVGKAKDVSEWAELPPVSGRPADKPVGEMTDEELMRIINDG